ncbi:PH domain-like protein [Lindgomyces ingoldianus]|uniref:PH domain-like protein n=1 Tax=Lindgomyces ingoldianus TaxID=673940 RepID=A0ACB6R691_9PLEO|nr:PH domain-like protein [Lindgomyces ingoldianus]KAF2474295.1 PH domain-like protein [Lindgomyces ingoldianus]
MCLVHGPSVDERARSESTCYIHCWRVYRLYAGGDDESTGGAHVIGMARAPDLAPRCRLLSMPFATLFPRWQKLFKPLQALYFVTPAFSPLLPGTRPWKTFEKVKMAPPPHKAKPRPPHHPQPQPSDYETDAPLPIDLPPPPPRSNEELNLAVLRRHYPEVVSVQHIAHYAVVYTFSQDSALWEKSGVEGTLFVCELAPSPTGANRFSVIILNRRGLDNFRIELTSDADMEITDEYVILQDNNVVYGLWVFSEPPPSSTANNRVETAGKIRVLAKQAADSRQARDPVQRNGAEAADREEDSVPMGRQLSLRELFGQQREQDAAWSVHNHHSPGLSSGFAPTPDPAANKVVTQLFTKAKQDYNGIG